MSQKPVRLVALLMAAAIAGLTGCTLVGYGIGRAIDKGHVQGTIALRGVEFVRLEPGTPVKLYSRDGTESAGRLEGLAPVSPEYTVRYAAAREAPGAAALPALGQGVDLEKRKGKRTTAAFGGFEPGAILLTYPKEAASRSVPFGEVAHLAWPEGVLDAEVLTSRMLAGQLPFQSRLIVDGRKIPLESIERIERPNPRRSAARTGIIIGAALDVIIMTALMVDASNNFYSGDSWSGGSSSTSCPFVYAWDGHAYHREAELFGGAMLKALAVTDRAPLIHLQPVGGRVRLRVANEQGEIDFLDRIGLVEVEVPEGATLVATPEGGLDLLRSRTPPGAARDRRGQNVRAALVAQDGEEWTSDPFGLDPATESPRDELTLEYVRPAGARAVTLAFTLRSTAWGAGLLPDLLRLQGRDLNVFYARLEANPVQRSRFVAALAREGLPRIEVWSGEAWQPVGFLRNLGPLLREQAVRVALPDLPSDFVRVRLSATAGMWRVDRAVADFTPRSPLRTRALPLLSARDLRNDSVAEALEGADGRAIALPPWSSSVELEFDAGEDEGRGRRVFAVEATGHYRILLPARGAPQRALFERLVNEPGAFGRYAIATLRREAVEQGTAMVAP